MLEDLRVILGAMLGSGIITLVMGWHYERDLAELRGWARGLAAHAEYPPPPEPKPRRFPLAFTRE